MNKEVSIVIVGPVGSGKSALYGEIEILLKALGVTYRHADPAAAQAEKNMTGADWTSALRQYLPTVVLEERLDPGRDAEPARQFGFQLADSHKPATLDWSEVDNPNGRARPVQFVGLNPLALTEGALRPMVPSSWRFGFTEIDGALRFGQKDTGPLVAVDAVADQQAAAIQQVTALRGALIALVGASAPEELRLMKAALAAIPTADADKVAAIQAIDALLATGIDHAMLHTLAVADDPWIEESAEVPLESDGEVFVRFTDGSIGTGWATYWHGASQAFNRWSHPDPDESRQVDVWMRPPRKSEG